jgi:hypothetical protein
MKRNVMKESLVQRVEAFAALVKAHLHKRKGSFSVLAEEKL